MGKELRRIGAPFRQPEWSALALIDAPEFRPPGSHATSSKRALRPSSRTTTPSCRIHLGDDVIADRGAALTRASGELARKAADAAAHPGERRRLVATIIWLVRTRTLRRGSSASVVLDDRCLVGTVRRSLGRRDTQPRVRARRDRRGGATARCRAASLGSVRPSRSLQRRRQARRPHRAAFRRHDR